MSDEMEHQNLNTEDYENSDDDNELQSTQDALKMIESAWLNEKFAPEILPHKMDLIESIIDQIDYFEEQLKRLEKSDLRFDIHTMELSRIRFIISSYIRARLDKIERFVHHILEQEESRNEDKYLTEKEMRFALDYKNNMETLFSNIALQYMPPIARSVTYNSKPNLNSHVVFKVIKSAPNVVVNDNNDEYDIELEIGSQHIIPYRSISHLVKDGSVQLV